MELWFPYVFEYLRRLLLLLFYMVCISSLSDAGCTTEVMNGEEKVPVPVTEHSLYFSKCAKFRAPPQPDVRPILPE